MATRPGRLTFRRAAASLALLLLVLFAVMILGISVGSVDIPVTRVIGALAGTVNLSATERAILFDLRLPRILLAFVVGAALSVAGVVFQALLRNPLAEPYILGISSGGTVGALIAIVLFAGSFSLATPVFAFAGCAVVMILVFTLGYRNGQLDPYTLLLSGVMVGAFFNALILVGFSLWSHEIRSAFLWLMGNLSGAQMSSFAIVAAPLLAAFAYLVIRSKDFNLVSTGDESALQLGVDVPRFRRVAYILASLLTAIGVSFTGIIGFVGLLVPHLCRLLFGPDHRLLLPASFLAGGAFLVAADVVSRVVLAPAEIPVGAVTAAIGAPLFVYLLKK